MQGAHAFFLAVVFQTFLASFNGFSQLAISLCAWAAYMAL